jgi:amino acid adenylation domain-containing protein/non-ribosomal peptide synthase protein (TIGR01720 family)
MHKKYPLTYAQQALWVEWKLNPTNTSYNTCVQLKLTGPLDPHRFTDALYNVVRYFESFRTFFHEENGLPEQRIGEEEVRHLEFISIESENEAETEEAKKQALDILAKRIQTPVPLTQYPICRGILVQSAKETFYFLGIMPHIIADGYSAIMFLDATSVAYNKGIPGLDDVFSNSKKTMQDFIDHENNSLTPEKIEAGKQYWLERLKDIPSTLDFGKSRHDISTAGKRIYITLDEAESSALKKIASAHRTTLFSSISALLNILLYRYYNQDDIVIGFPVNVRPGGFKHLFGFFVNVMPLRTDLSGNPTFNDIVAQTAQARRQDKKHLTYPALEILRNQREVNPNFDGQIFNVSLAQTVSRLYNLTLDGIESEPVEIDYDNVNDEFSLYFEVGDNYIDLMVEYRTELFSQAYIDQFIKHLKDVATWVSKNPDTHIDDIPLLTSNEKDTILSQLTSSNIPISDKSIGEAILDQATKTPNAPCITFKKNTLTYNDVAQHIHSITTSLQQAGVKPGDRVAVCLNRSERLLPTLYAVLATGATYVPIHPNETDVRQEMILSDCEPTLIITDKNTASKFESTSYTQLDIGSIEITDNHAVIPTTPLNTIAYIMYTSGSTGKPKGVTVSHKNVLSRFADLQDTFKLNETSTYLQNTTYTFDISVPEIFWPAQHGAHTVLSSEEEHLHTGKLIALMESLSVTHAGFTPTMLLNLVQNSTSENCPSLEHILACGESLPKDTIEKTYATLPHITLHNYYGPTEATIYATETTCPKDTPRDYDCIGKPMKNTSALILDANLNIQPVGIPGNLYLGGIGVTPGYLNRDTLTKEKFIPNPFKAGDIIYDTGDVAALMPDGNIKYLGRSDSQIKLRGHRIELGEIESVLRNTENVSDAAVCLHEYPTGPKLIGYLETAANIDQKELETSCKSKLPAHMCPSFFVALDTFPKTQSGKLNKKALQKPSLNTTTTAFVAPNTDTETRLQELFAKVLKQPQETIGIHHNFFELGGDSLLAMQLVSFIEQDGHSLSAHTLFEKHTIFDLAEALDSGDESAHHFEPVYGSFPLLPRQLQHVNGTRNPDFYNRHFALQLDHEPDLELLNDAFQDVLNLHTGMRATFSKQDTEWQMHIPETVPPTDIQHISLENTPDPMAIYKDTLETANRSFKLNQFPLFKVVLFTFSDSESHLVIVASHMIFDITSCRIILEDLITSYMQRLLGQTVLLPHPTASPALWATTLHDFSQTFDFTLDRDYWNRTASFDNPNIPLLSHNTEEENADANKKECRVTFPENVTTNILKQDNASHALIEALANCITRYTGQEKFKLSIASHGRYNADSPVFSTISLTRSVGWCNTVHPIKIDTTKSIPTQLSHVPYNGFHYPILKHINNETVADQSTVFFNYMGQLDGFSDNAAIKPIELPVELPITDPENSLGYLVLFEGAVHKQQLSFRITYAGTLISEEEIEKLLDYFKSEVTSKSEEKTVISA